MLNYIMRIMKESATQMLDDFVDSIDKNMRVNYCGAKISLDEFDNTEAKNLLVQLVDGWGVEFLGDDVRDDLINKINKKVDTIIPPKGHTGTDVTKADVPKEVCVTVPKESVDTAADTFECGGCCKNCEYNILNDDDTLKELIATYMTEYLKVQECDTITKEQIIASSRAFYEFASFLSNKGYLVDCKC